MVALVEDILESGWITENDYRTAIEQIKEGKFIDEVEYALKQVGIE